MTDDEGFAPRPRSDARQRDAFDLANARDALDAIRARVDRVANEALDEFHDGTAAYDSASLAVIRLHALLERPENGWMNEVLTTTELRSIRTLRNIIAHAGYRAMDDERFWIACTRDIPNALDRLIEKAGTPR